MSAPDPRDDLAQQILTLAGDLAGVQSRLRELGDPATLRAQVTGLKRQLATLTGADSGGISNLAAALGAVSDRVTAIEDLLSRRGASPVWDLTTLPGALEGTDREQAMTQLTGWVDDVLGGVYQLTGPPNPAAPTTARLPACWAQHPDLVADLAWLAQEWIQIYRTAYGTPARAGDWHDRQLPGFRTRLPHTAAACTRASKHIPPPPDGQPSASRPRLV